MTDHQKYLLALGEISRFPDIDLRSILDAIASARAQVLGDASLEAIVARAVANLPEGVSSFERGVVSGIVLAQKAGPRQF